MCEKFHQLGLDLFSRPTCRSRGGSRIFERGGGVQIRSRPTSKKGESRPPGHPPPPGSATA